MEQCAYKTTMFALLFSQNLALFLLYTIRLADLFIFFYLANLLTRGGNAFHLQTRPRLGFVMCFKELDLKSRKFFD